MDPAAAAALLEDLTDRVLASEFEPVVRLEAPELAEVPVSLRRADGRSIYQRHGGTRYATHAQLAMEERMLAQARADGAPRLARERAAHALGADLARLESALTGAAPDMQAQPTEAGLREDQAAAALAALTDGRLVSVINAPAGSGKTRVLAEAARIWTAAGLGPVIGITPSQSARNTLAAGVPGPITPAQFLGHLPGRRGARGPVPIGPGTLLVVDEASMLPGPDLADLIAYARARGAKVILAGDVSQLQAVENGGGMSLLATELGYARLAEPVRFRHQWEQHASLRLRDGDTSVLAEYGQHGRIHGGDPEQTIDAAAAAYTALSAAGTDVLLMAADHTLRRELSRRIRDDLIALGMVSDGPAVRIADGAQASPGDLIICTRNDHTTEAGEPRRSLANGDLLRIETVTREGLIVRRALGADPSTGQRRWTDRHFLFNGYQDAELGYAVTDHAAQGRTVHTGLAVITGTEDRQHAYVALTRGTDANHAHVFIAPPKRADPVPGPRPAPELVRYDRISSERAGVPAPAAEPVPPDAALGVLAAVLGHDGQQQSATQARNKALSDADHLALLHAIWTAETAPAREQRYEALLAAALPPGCPARPARGTGGCGGRCTRPNSPAWTPPASSPTRSANGTSPAPVTSRPSSTPASGTGPASWSPSRPDRGSGASPPSPTPNAAPMSSRSPSSWTPASNASASTRPNAPCRGPSTPSAPCPSIRSPGWTGSTGLPPSRPGASCPATTTQPTRSGPNPPRPPRTCGPPGMRPWPLSARSTVQTCGGCRTGCCCTCATPIPSRPPGAPPWVGDELCQVRDAAWKARLTGLRAAAEADAARRRDDYRQAAREQERADSYRALEEVYRQRETVFAAVMADRTEWEAATRQQRQLAVAADAELRRRHPGQYLAPLRSAEGRPAARAQRAELTLTAREETPESGQWIKDLAADRRTFADRLADRQSVKIPSEDPHYGDLGPAFPAWTGPGQEPILQPPKPKIPPSPRILERVMDRDADWEAAD